MQTNFNLFIFQKIIDDPTEEIKVENQTIPWKPTAKYLGIWFDKRLTWNPHTHQIADKLDPTLPQIYLNICRKSKLDTRNKLNLYKALILPIILYANTVWGHTSKTNLHKIESFHNKILRIIYNGGWYIRNKQIRRELIMKTIKEEIIRRNQSQLNNFINHPNNTLTDQLLYDINN